MIFINNKYTDIYYKIIDKAKNRILSPDIYSEGHHIIPKCLGGSNSSHNIAILTSREHFICHWLLIKMTRGNAYEKMLFAVAMMRAHAPNQQRYSSLITSRVYEKYKIEGAKVRSKLYFGKARNTTKYKFCHTGGAVEYCSILELTHKYGLSRSSIAHLVKKPTEKHHVKGWSIDKLITDINRSTLYSGSGGPKYDHTKYVFQHVDGHIEHCTKYELFTKYNLKRDGIYFICNGKQQSSQGWSLQVR